MSFAALRPGQFRSILLLMTCALVSACAPRFEFDDGPGNVVWREVLLTAGIEPFKPIRDLTLEEAGRALAPCLSLTPSCADEILATQPDLRGAALTTAWPYALRDTAERFVPILLERGAVADGRAMIEAMQRPREHSTQRLAIIEYLLKAGAEVDAVDFDGDTPLHRAADQSDAELVELLLAHGADPSRKTRTGLTALQLAQAQGDKPTIKQLQFARKR